MTRDHELRRVERRRGQFEQQPEPEWKHRALEQLSPADRRAVEVIQGEFARYLGPDQVWYQADARTDLTATILAPACAKHWRVDPAYSADSFVHGYHPHGKENYGKQLTNPFQALGANVEVALPWQDAWQQGRQGMRLAGETVLEMRGGHHNDPKTMPTQVDVIYDALGSPQVGPELLSRLSIGGIIVAESSKDYRKILPLTETHRSLTSLGFSDQGSAIVRDLHVPALELSRPRGRLNEDASAHLVRSVFLTVFRKDRELIDYDEHDVQYACFREGVAKYLPLFLRTGDQRLLRDIELVMRHFFDATVAHSRSPLLNRRLKGFEDGYLRHGSGDIPLRLLSLARKLKGDVFVGETAFSARTDEFIQLYQSLRDEYSRKGLAI